MKLRSLLQAESYRAGFLASSGLTFFAQLAGFATISLFAHYFGAGVRTDLYLYATGIITAASMYLVSLMQGVIVPEGMRIEAAQGRPAAVAFFNAGLAVLAIPVLLVLVPAGISPTGFLAAISRYEPEQLAPHALLVRMLVPLFAMEAVNTTLAQLCMAYRFFSLPNLAALVQRLLQAAFLVALHDRLGVVALLIASCASHALYLGVLLWILFRRTDWTLRFSFAALRGPVLRDCGLAAGSNFVSGLVLQVPAYLMTGLAQGTVTLLNYATRLSGLPQALVLLPFSNVAGIRLNRAAATGGGELDNAFRNSLVTLALMLFPATFWIAIEAPSLIRAIFGHGALQAEEVQASATFLRAAILALPFLGLNSVNARLFASCRRIPMATAYQIAQSLVLLLCYRAGHQLGGAFGIVLAGSLFYVWTALSVWPVLKRIAPAAHYGRALAAFGRAGLVCAVAAAPALVLHRLLAGTPALVTMAASGSAYAASLFVALRLVRFSPEVDRTLEQVLHALRRVTGPAPRAAEGSP